MDRLATALVRRRCGPSGGAIGRRSVLWLALAGAAAFSASPAQALQESKFDEGKFAAAQAAGKPILVDVTAPWCPTCRTQKAILYRLARDPHFDGLVVFQINFDSQEALLSRFGVSMQSTLISFKGWKEVGRSVGDTDASSIKAQVEKSF